MYPNTPPGSSPANITNNLQVSQTSIFPSLFAISETIANVTTAFLEVLSLLNLETSRGDTYKYNKMCYNKKQTSMNVKRKKQLDLSWKIILKNFL